MAIYWLSRILLDPKLEVPMTTERPAKKMPSNTEWPDEDGKLAPVKIDKSFVARDLPPGFYRDREEKGFTLKVTPSRKKVYIFQRRPKGDRKMLTYTIGEHDSSYFPADKATDDREVNYKLTAERARKEARYLSGLMRDGKNPKQEEEAEKQKKQEAKKVSEAERIRNAYSVREAFDDYLSKNKRLRDSTKKAYRYDFLKRCSDWLDMPLLDITVSMAKERHEQISEGGHSAQANTVMRIFRAIFNKANKDKDWGAKCPTRTIDWEKIAPRETYITDEELPAWFEAVLKLPDAAMKDFFRLALLTGLRKTEALSLTWDQIDFKQKTLTIPKERAKNGHELTLPLSNYVYDLLAVRYSGRDKSNEFVFPSYTSNSGHFTDTRGAEKWVCDKSKVKSSPHAWRRTLGQKAAEMLPELVVKAILNHRENSNVTQTHYASLKSAERLREPMERLTTEILRLAKIEYNSVTTLAVLPKAMK